MQDNYFFKEPETQRMLLDILFIYSKLNPDIGYRQGMHELLAPLLWVIHQDAVEPSSVAIADRQAEGAELMLDILDHNHREADAFSLFCAVMQTAKSFYEMGDNRDSSPIVAKSRRIHEDLLGTFDPELALHLQVAGVLPQIYAIRWIRLLFGREFDFKDVLRIWDVLFAQKLRPDIIDMTCVAMLLRMRWTLVEADYTTAITTLTHVKLPEADNAEDQRTLVRDAILLDKSRSAETGADLIQRYSGRRPKSQQGPERSRISLDDGRAPDRRGSRTPQYRPSPNLSPARFTGPQKQLESLFNDVSGGIRSRAEGWTSVSRAVRGAVGEVRRNMTQYQPVHSRNSSVDVLGAGSETLRGRDDGEYEHLRKRVKDLEDRNKALAKMLDGALEELRKSRPASGVDAADAQTAGEETFNISLAKIQFVSVYLGDSEIPIPPEDFSAKTTQPGQDDAIDPAQPESSIETETATAIEAPIDVPRLKLDEPTAGGAEGELHRHEDSGNVSQQTVSQSRDPSASRSTAPVDEPAMSTPNANPKSAATSAAHIKTSEHTAPSPSTKITPAARPSLQDASFSFMLGENRHRSSFVSSVASLPEHERRSSNDRELGNGRKQSNASKADDGAGRRKGILSAADKAPVRGKLRKPGRELGGRGGGDVGDEEGDDLLRLTSFRGKSSVEKSEGEGGVGEGGPL